MQSIQRSLVSFRRCLFWDQKDKRGGRSSPEWVRDNKATVLLWIRSLVIGSTRTPAVLLSNTKAVQLAAQPEQE